MLGTALSSAIAEKNGGVDWEKVQQSENIQMQEGKQTIVF
jgi:hypothetical protein